MIRNDPSPYETCRELFAAYPLAVTGADVNGDKRSMVLMLKDNRRIRFFVLLGACDADKPSFSIFPWRADGIIDIEPDGNVPDVAANAVKHGIPIPRDGSLFGWTGEKAVTALVTVRAKYTPDSPVPSWTVMPLVGIPETRWPPFTDKRFFGKWFWKYYHAGKIISVADLIGGAPNTVFWVDTEAILGSGCCAVTRDIRSAEGYELQRGCYVYYKVLREGMQVPPLSVLLASTAITDLTPRFPSAGARSTELITAQSAASKDPGQGDRPPRTQSRGICSGKIPTSSYCSFSSVSGAEI